jgi:hypothetical protein
LQHERNDSVHVFNSASKLFSHLLVFYMHFQYFQYLHKAPYYMLYVLNLPTFQYFKNFISIYAQNSVKILTNPYTWRHWFNIVRSPSYYSNILFVNFQS